MYKELVEVVKKGERKFLTTLGVKVSISECEVRDNELLFQGRRWVPDLESLCTKVIQETYDLIMTRHPGREATAATLA